MFCMHCVFQVECEGLPEGCFAHKGMVQAAKFVLQRLEETRAVADALLARNGYGLVITGNLIPSFFIL